MKQTDDIMLRPDIMDSGYPGIDGHVEASTSLWSAYCRWLALMAVQETKHKDRFDHQVAQAQSPSSPNWQ